MSLDMLSYLMGTNAAGGSGDDKVSIYQGVENAGKFLIVGADGNVTVQTLATWQGGNY